MYQELQRFGRVKTNEPLAKHTTFKIGGPADFFVVAEDKNNLVALLRWLDGEGAAYFILGGGSNLLVRDEGYRGVVINLKNAMCEVNGALVTAGAGCVTVEVARQSIQAGLTGFEWGVGVPGTIGGAVRGNAGAMGGETGESVSAVEVYRSGEVVSVPGSECGFGYRESVFKRNHDVILSATLALEKSENKEGMRKALENLQYRTKTQPQGYASTGCIFKNVEISQLSPEIKNKIETMYPEDADIRRFFTLGKLSAGWLIEASGMKGARAGAAAVSERHGNFVVNLGAATAADVLSLIERTKEKVYTKFGIAIEEEIQII